jgi:hypothetical protein
MAKMRTRPSTYTEEVIALFDDYLENWKDKYGDEIPSIEGLAGAVGRSRETMYAWNRDEDKPEISDTLLKIKELQTKVTLNKGLNGEFNATIAKLVLANHGWHDKKDSTVDATVSVKAAKDMTDDELAALASGANDS